MVVGYLAAVGFGIASYIVMGVVSLTGDKASRLNRLYFAMGLALTLWSAAFILQQLSGGFPAIFIKTTAGLSILFFSLLCRSSVLSLSGGWKRAATAATYGGGLAALGITVFLSEKAGAFSRNLGFLVHSAPLDSVAYLAQIAYCLAAGLVGFIILSIRAFRMEDAREKRGAVLTLAFLGVCLAMFYANQAALPLAFGLSAPYCSPLVFAPWALAVIFVQRVNGALSDGGRNGAQAPSPQIPDYSLTVDLEGAMLEANGPAQAMLGRSAEELKGKPLGFALERSEPILGELRRMSAANAPESSCVITWIPRQGKPCRGRARISAVRNAFGRATGYLITPFTLGESGALKDEYSLTDREIEVIHFAAQGLPNSAIARELTITERTVKAHLTNIYNKMGIDSRIKLMTRLKDFDI